MKPVIRKQTHYNLVLMRDDTNPRTLRLSDTTLCTGIFSLVALLLFGIGGLTAGGYYWQKYRALQAKHASLDKEASEMRLQLERLVTLETLINASNGSLPHAPIKHEEVGVPAPTLPVTLPGTVPGATDDPAGSPKDDAATVTPVYEDQDGGATLTPEESSAVAPQTPVARVLDDEALLLVDEDSPLRITGFSARYSGPQGLRIGYDLVAATPGVKIYNGNVEYFITFTDGTRQALPMQDGQNRSFSISRRKNIQAPTRVPEPYTANDAKEVDVVIELTDGVRYHQTFAVK